MHRNYDPEHPVPSRAKLRSQEARRVLADHFVKQWLRPTRSPVPVSWVKVVAEHAMGAMLGLDGYVWIDQDNVEAALKAAGYKLRPSGRELYVACGPQDRDLNVWRFFKRGGHYPRKR